MQRLLTAGVLAAVIIAAAFAGVHNASNRRAEYLEREAAAWECMESGLDRNECIQGVGL